MPQFRRFVAYLYYYENDVREYLAGFAKVEIRGGICRLEIHLKGTVYTNKEGKVCLFTRKEGKVLAFPVGSMRMMTQSSDYMGKISEEELGEESCRLQEMSGILIQMEDGNFYGSQWDEGEIHKEEITFYSEEKKEPEIESEPEIEREQEIQKKPVIQKEPEPVEAAEEPTLQTEEVPMRRFFPEQHAMGKQQPDSIWTHWENLKRKMTILHPFEGENITCVHMELRDIRELPERYWYLGDNSFLLHGFFNYRYLFFGEQVTPEGKELFLAVPGVYQKPEKVMAAIFGFPQFRTEKPCQQLEGTFGYWYRRMNE